MNGNRNDEEKVCIARLLEIDSGDIIAEAVSDAVERCKKIAEESKFTVGEVAGTLECMALVYGVTREEAFRIVMDHNRMITV